MLGWIVVGAGKEDFTGEEAQLPNSRLRRRKVGLLDANDPAFREQAFHISVLLHCAAIHAD